MLHQLWGNWRWTGRSCCNESRLESKGNVGFAGRMIPAEAPASFSVAVERTEPMQSSVRSHSSSVSSYLYQSIIETLLKSIKIFQYLSRIWFGTKWKTHLSKKSTSKSQPACSRSPFISPENNVDEWTHQSMTGWTVAKLHHTASVSDDICHIT